MEEASLSRFLSCPDGRFVRARNAAEWCVGGVLGFSVFGRLSRDDIELFGACIPVVKRLPRGFASVADLRGYVGFAPGLLEEWFSVGLEYLAAANARAQRLCVSVLPVDFEARAALTGIYSLSGLTLAPTVQALSHAWALLDAPPLALASLERTLPFSGALGLSPRQLQVAQLAARGDDDGLIAQHLGIRESTVGSHLHRVYRLLGVHNRVDLANRLSERGKGVTHHSS